jgi:putative transposase
VSERVSRAQSLVTEYPVATIARVVKVSRQAIYGRRSRPHAVMHAVTARARVEHAIVDVARANPTDGYRMVTALVSRRLGRPVNRKRVLRVMRQHTLIQRRRPLRRRKRPGRFEVTAPNQLWHLDMTSVWTATHGWCYLMAAIDCYTREIVSWRVELRCRAREAIELVADAALRRDIAVGKLTLGTDNGPAFTARAFKAHLDQLGIKHRRGGYRDPESQAFIESWFGKLKQREVWLNEYGTVHDARGGIARYIAYYHDHPHSSLVYMTPTEVWQHWTAGNSAA